jgi:hypothetical protein
MGILSTAKDARDDCDDFKLMYLQHSHRPDLYHKIDWNNLGQEHLPAAYRTLNPSCYHPPLSAAVEVYCGKFSGRRGTVLYSDPQRVIFRGPLGLEDRRVSCVQIPFLHRLTLV